MFSPSPTKLLVVQIFCALALVPFIILADPIWLLVAAFFYLLYAGIGIALGFHRVLSHNAFHFNPIVRNFILIVGSLANVGSPLTWVAIHRAHHRYCDTPRDPHSPNYHSTFFVLFLSMFAKVSLRHVAGLLRDDFVLFIHKHYFLIQFPWIALLAVLGGWQAVLACHFIPGGLTWLAGSFLNWFNHVHGYRNFNCEDTSRNHWLTAVLVFGEGWHNNHHAKPAAATTKIKSHEFDLIYWLARLLGGKPKFKNVP